MDVSFVMSAFKPEHLPPAAVEEIAVVGRSNSGKSTLINAVLQRKSIARRGKTPGQTQSINFFRVGDGGLMLADLPGYGFAKAPREVMRFWQELVDAYIARKARKTFLFLMDCRRDLDSEDKALLQLLSEHGPVWLVLTKSDKIAKSKAKQNLDRMAAAVRSLGVDCPEAFIVSSLAKETVEPLRSKLFGLDGKKT